MVSTGYPPGWRILLFCLIGAILSCDQNIQLGKAVRTAYSRLLAVQCAKGGKNLDNLQLFRQFTTF